MNLKKDAPVKYHLGTHRLCSAYPTETDVLYDIIGYVISSNKRKKGWKSEDIKMKFDDLKSVFPDIGNDDFKATVRTILSTLHTNNDITLANDEQSQERYIAVTKKGFTKLYEE